MLLICLVVAVLLTSCFFLYIICMIVTDNTTQMFIVVLTVKTELKCCPLDESLSNIQWLGKMSTHTQPAQKETNMETQCGVVKLPQVPMQISFFIFVKM